MSDAKLRAVLFHLGGEHLQRIDEDYLQDKGPEDPSLITATPDCRISKYDLAASRQLGFSIDLLIVEDDLQPLASILNSANKASNPTQIIGVCTDAQTLEMLFEKLPIGPQGNDIGFSAFVTRKKIAGNNGAPLRLDLRQ